MMPACAAGPARLLKNPPACRPRPQFYIGDQLLDARDVSQLNMRRPFDRGYLVNWGLQVSPYYVQSAARRS